MNILVEHAKSRHDLSRRSARLLLPIFLVSCGLLLAGTPALGAPPLPTEIVIEKTLTEDQAEVVFEDLAEELPAGSRHLVLEIFSAVSNGDGEPATVKLTFNDDTASNYVNRQLYAEGDHIGTDVQDPSTAADLMRIPPASGQRFGGGQSFIPWAFLHDQSKHSLTWGGANEDYLSTNMSHWTSPQPISSIQLRLEGEGNFAAGSSFQLFTVDERYRIDETVLLQDESGIGFSDLPQGYGNLIVIGQTRSSEVRPVRRGDRVWYSINGDAESSHYQIQRLTGEEEKIQRTRMKEPRIGWNTAETAPDGVFGPWVLYYPEYANTDMWRTFLSRHGTHDKRFDPVGNEIGRWTSSASIEELRFFPQEGEAFKAGSRIGIYRPKEPVQRYVVAEGGEQTVSLHLPCDTDGMQVHVTARSEDTELDEDRLLFELNGDGDQGHYAHQRATALGPREEVSREDNNEIGILPSGSSPAMLMSSTYSSFKGACDSDRQTAVLSYGGVPGDGRIGFYGGRWKQADNVTSLTFRTKSGAHFSAGSVFTVWAAEYNSDIDGAEYNSAADDDACCAAPILLSKEAMAASVVAVPLAALLVFLIVGRRRKARS